MKMMEGSLKRFSKIMENTGEKKVALYEQFLLFPQCFQNTVQQTCKDKGLLGKGKSIVGKGGNCCQLAFSFFFTQGFQQFQNNCQHFCYNNPLPHKPILGCSISAANKDMMSKIWTSGDTII